jgi:hypothetical protein
MAAFKKQYPHQNIKKINSVGMTLENSKLDKDNIFQTTI